MADFSKPFTDTLVKEGFQANAAPGDKGGWTIYGLARLIDIDFEGWAYIDQMQKENPAGFPNCLRADPKFLLMVRNYYKNKYWNTFGGDFILDQAVAEELYDFGVNCGVEFVCKTFQQILNIGNRDQKDYADIPVDGKIGPLTITAFNTLLKKRGEAAILKVINQRHGARYFDICLASPGQEIFFWGWELRT